MFLPYVVSFLYVTLRLVKVQFKTISRGTDSMAQAAYFTLLH